MTTDHLTATVRGFTEERDRQQFHPPKKVRDDAGRGVGELLAELQ